MNQIASEPRYSDLAGATLVGISDYAFDGDQRVTSIMSYDATGSVPIQ